MYYINKVALSSKFFLMSLGVGVVSLLHFIVFFPISIDDELTAARIDPAVWIAQDRWFAFLVELVFDQPVVPGLYYLVFIFLITLSFLALVKSIGLNFGLTAVIAFGLVISYPTVFLLISFAGNVLPLGFGFVFSGLALLSFTSVISDPLHNVPPKPRSKKVLNLAASSIFLALSLGSYHSSALLFFVGVFGWVLANKYSNQRNFTAMSTGFVVFLFGLGVWKLISEISIFIYKPPLNQLEYIAGYWRPEAFWLNPFESFLSLIEKIFLFYAVEIGRAHV